MPSSRPQLWPLLILSAAVGCEAPYRTASVDTRNPDVRLESPPTPSRAPVLRFSVAAIESPRDTYSSYTRLFDRMGQLLGTRVEFEQRRTYREVNDLLISGQLEAALLCTGGYLDLQRRAPGAFEAVAVPVVSGEESYRSVIVVAAYGPVKDVAGLRGLRFAYTDELSFSGRLYALRVLRDLGADPEHFFGAVTFTGSHDRSIQAVATGLVDGAAVHGGVLAQMQEADASLQRRLRVIHQSPPTPSSAPPWPRSCACRLALSPVKGSYGSATAPQVKCGNWRLGAKC